MSTQSRGLLGAIERIGNRLPDPVTLFLLGALLVLALSQLGAMLEWSAVNPTNDAVVVVKPLLSGEGLEWVWTSMVENFTGFAPLGVVLVAMLGIGVAERTGLIAAILKILIRVTPRMLVVPGLVFAGVMSSMATDAGYVVLPPLAAAIFASMGRSPLVGIAAVFVGVGGGFSANLAITAIDPLLGGATQQAAQLLDENAVVPVTANYYFMIASTFLVTIVGWLVTAFVVEPRFDKAEVERQIAAGRAAASEDEDVDRPEGRPLVAAGFATLLVGVGLLLLVLVPGAPLSGTIELRPGVEMPVWAEAMVPMLFVLFLVPGVVFGIANGTIKGDRDAAGMLTKSMASMGGYIVLAFFCGQFVAWFSESGLGTILAIRGIEVLSSWNLPRELLVVAVILLTAGLNLFIGSASAKWFLLAPVFVPLFLGLGVSPELTQAAYRVGDSTTNIIAPLNPYLVIIIVFMRRYVPGAGIGSVLSLMLPYTIALLMVWPVLLLVWTSLGIPLGPDNGPLFMEPMVTG
ncbi:MAG: aminobenzoyl-glutamate transporter [Phycisphaerae bacterium]|nr:aminobenzoyl-glutamate transporter [Phycisphaerae bacterium]